MQEEAETISLKAPVEFSYLLKHYVEKRWCHGQKSRLWHQIVCLGTLFLLLNGCVTLSKFVNISVLPLQNGENHFQACFNN